MARDPYRYFRIEARELLEQLGRGTLDLEKGGDPPTLVSRLLRLTHTLKGAARVVRQGAIADHAHAIEDILVLLRDPAARLQREQVDAMLARLDQIGALVAELGPGEGGAAEAGATPTALASVSTAASAAIPPAVPAATVPVPPPTSMPQAMARAAQPGSAQRPQFGPAPGSSPSPAFGVPPQSPPHPQPLVAVPRAAAPAAHAPLAAAAIPTPTPLAAPVALQADTAELDALLDGVALTHAQLAGMDRALHPLQSARELARLLAEQLAPRRARAAGSAAPAASAAARGTAERLGGLLERLERSVAAPLEQMDRELRQLRDAAEQLRLLPAAALFTPLERLARDTARSLGKQVVFEGRGGSVRLEAQVLSALQAPLLQMVRNAVVHGIEASGRRVAAGKPPAGSITLTVQRQGRRVLLRCSDDGAGVDLEAVRRAAQRQGQGLAGAASLTPNGSGPADDAYQGSAQDDQALLQRLLRGGLSTVTSVTEAAGRGVGLDLVRETVDQLGGEVSVQTAAGQGTTLTLSVPLSLASLDALLVETDGATVAIPLDAVRRAVRIDAREIVHGAHGDSIADTSMPDGAALPLVPLARLLQRSGSAAGASTVLSPHSALPDGPPRLRTAVVVASVHGSAAIGVDRLLGTAHVVLRALPALAPAGAVVAGASLDIEGNPQLILDPEGLVGAAQRAGAPAPQPLRPRAPVLVIDDSLTTRMLEQSILESAGYEVHTAASAEQGLERARQQRYALFLVDVEMPGMDGFSFVEQTRADPVLREVPAMLVTSRGSDEDRQRGQQAGASGYIVKGEFAQDIFLQRVRQLVGAR